MAQLPQDTSHYTVLLIENGGAFGLTIRLALGSKAGIHSTPSDKERIGTTGTLGIFRARGTLNARRTHGEYAR